MLKLQATPSFQRAVKKLHAADKAVVDAAVQAIAENPALGVGKKGDLAAVLVHKFKIRRQEVLLAYMLQPSRAAPSELVLLSLGSHENFYADLKKK